MTFNFEDFFDEAAKPDSGDNAALQELAESIALEDYELADMKARVAEKDAKVKAMKGQLCQAMIDKGIEKLSFDNGLSPSKMVKPKFFKAKGVDDEKLHAWLTEAGLADIIKPYVHFNTLQATLKDYQNAGHEIPEEIINETEELSVRLNGKSKFINNHERKDK